MNMLMSGRDLLVTWLNKISKMARSIRFRLLEISQRFRGPMLQAGAGNLYTEARLMVEGIVPLLQMQTWGTTRAPNSRAGSFASGVRDLN